MDKIYGHRDFVPKTRKDKELGDVIEDIVQPTWDDYWWEDDEFDNTDTRPTIDQSKKILDDEKWETPTSTEPLHNVDINALVTNILKNIRSVDNRTPQELIDDDFDYWADVDQNWVLGDTPSAPLSIPLDTRTWQERQDDDNISLKSENEAVTIEDLPEPIINVSLPTTKKIPMFKVADPEPPIVTVLPRVQPTPIPPTAPPKTMDVDIRALSDTILKGLKRPAPPPLLQPPRDDRNLQDLTDDDFIPLDDRDPTEMVRDRNEPLVRPFRIITTTVTDDGGEPVIETGPSQKIDISGQSIINQANKVLDYQKFKQDQAKKIRDYNNKLLKDTAKTIKYVENMKNVKPSNSLLIAAKKTREKYRKMRRRQRKWLNDADTINYVDDTSLNDVKENKNLLIATKKLKNLYRKMRESQRKKVNAENAQAVKLLQKLEEDEMNGEAVDLLWELEQEDAVDLLQDLEDEEQAVKLLQKLEVGDRKKRDNVAGKTRAKYKKLRLKNRAKTEKAMIQATDNAELEDFLRQLDDVESNRDAVNLLKKLEGEAEKGKIESAQISSKYKKTRQKNRQRDKLAMIAAANEAELEDQMIRATDLAEEAALHKDAIDHLMKLEADAKKSKNAAAKTLAKYAKVRQKNRQRDE